MKNSNLEKQEPKVSLYDSLNDLIGKPPGWISKSGIGLIGMATLLFFSMASVITYPDKIQAPIQIDSHAPMFTLRAQKFARIESLMANNLQNVLSGDTLIQLTDSNLTDINNIHMLAECNGLVQWNSTTKNYGSVSKNQILGHLICSERSSCYSGKIQISINDIGSINLNDKVLIHLDRYPFKQFGSLESHISLINIVSEFDAFNRQFYMAEVQFENGLITTFQNQLDYLPNLSGMAYILKENQSVLSRIFQPIKQLLNQRKYESNS